MRFIRTDSPNPVVRCTDRLPHLDDDQLSELLVNTRQALAATNERHRDDLISSLAWLELEFAARGPIAIDGADEPSPPSLVIEKLVRAAEAGDETEIGRLVGKLQGPDLVCSFDRVSNEHNPEHRYLAVAAVCVCLETMLSSWESAHSFAECYLDRTISVETRLRRIERRWGFLLGILAANATNSEE